MSKDETSEDTVPTSKRRLNITEQSPSRSLAEFRALEGRDYRKERLYALWQQICNIGYLSYPDHKAPNRSLNSEYTPDTVEKLRSAYEAELFQSCGGQSSKKQIGWTEFKTYALAKEVGARILYVQDLVPTTSQNSGISFIMNLTLTGMVDSTKESWIRRCGNQVRLFISTSLSIKPTF